MGREWPSVFFFFGDTKFTHAHDQYINRNSKFESVSYFSWIIRQDQSNVWQKRGRRFRRRVSVELNVLNTIRRGRNVTYETGLKVLEPDCWQYLSIIEFGFHKI